MQSHVTFVPEIFLRQFLNYQPRLSNEVFDSNAATSHVGKNCELGFLNVHMADNKSALSKICQIVIGSLVCDSAKLHNDTLV